MAGKSSSEGDLHEWLPLPQASFFVLFALAEGEKHGYRIMQDVRELSGGMYLLGPATLYTTIKKLTDQELISELLSSAEGRRRTYVLTGMGKRLLHAELHRQRALLDVARSKGLVR